MLSRRSVTVHLEVRLARMNGNGYLRAHALYPKLLQLKMHPDESHDR